MRLCVCSGAKTVCAMFAHRPETLYDAYTQVTRVTRVEVDWACARKNVDTHLPPLRMLSVKPQHEMCQYAPSYSAVSCMDQ